MLQIKMRIIVVFAALFAVVLSGPAPESRVSPEEGADPANPVESGDGTYVIEDLVNSELDLNVSASDFTFYYYSRSNLSGIEVNYDNVEAISDTAFSPSINTIFIVHDWKNDYESPVNTLITQAVLSKQDANVFVFDWGPIANQSYVSAKNSVVEVGIYGAAFIQALVDSYSLQITLVSLVGHGFGAHIAGFVARNIGRNMYGTVPLIIGTDPAAPLFVLGDTNERIRRDDAVFVQIIYTSGFLGWLTPLGDAEYFPNGGSSQPGCGLDLAGTCAHARSYEFIAESIAAPINLFISTQCDNYLDFSLGLCSFGAKSVMGGFPVDTSASGRYYLNTNSAPPYAEG